MNGKTILLNHFCQCKYHKKISVASKRYKVTCRKLLVTLYYCLFFTIMYRAEFICQNHAAVSLRGLIPPEAMPESPKTNPSPWSLPVVRPPD